MPSTVAVDGRWDDEPALTYGQELLEVLRVVAVAGIGWGLVGLGLGSRLAMFALRLTSPDSVRGTLSDDQFLIGRFTLAGTYNLAVLGGVFGVIAAAAYVAVAPWLIGPTWFRRFTVALTGAAIGGSALIHDEGIDFHVLKPQWFAVGLFLALPFVFALGLAVVVDRVAARDSWTRRGKTTFVLPLVLFVLLTANPLVAAVPFVGLVIAALLPVRRLLHDRIAGSSAGRLVARGFYLAIALYGFWKLAEDFTDLASLPVPVVSRR